MSVKLKTTITMKKIGNNLITVIDGKSVTKVLKTDEEKTQAKEILEKVKTYQTKPTKVVLDEVKKFTTPAGVKEKEVKKVKAKAIEKEIRKEKVKSSETKAKKELAVDLASTSVDDLTDEQAAEMLEKLQKRVKKTETVVTTQAQVAPVKRRGEY